jgi:hypothetical protein
MMGSPRKPRETDIYQLKSLWYGIAQQYNWLRAYIGAYSRSEQSSAAQTVDPSSNT